MNQMQALPVSQSNQDIQLQNQVDQPEDCVSDVAWALDNQFIFAISSFDGKIGIYQVTQNQNQPILQKILTLTYTEPIIRLAWYSDVSVLFGASSDNKIISFQLQSQNQTIIGSHNETISKIFWIQQNQYLMSFSYDKTINFWNIQGQLLKSIATKYPIYVADVQYPVCIFSYQDKFFIQNLKNLDLEIQYDNKSQNLQDSQIITIKINKKQDKVLFGANDSRVNCSSILSKYSGYFFNYNRDLYFTNVCTFKVAKKEKDNEILYFPVNSVGNKNNLQNFKIGFIESTNDIVFTSGGEGTISFWNIDNKNRCNDLISNSCVSQTQLNDRGNLMAYVQGYDWSQGIWGLQNASRPIIMVHQINQNDISCNQKNNNTNHGQINTFAAIR